MHKTRSSSRSRTPRCVHARAKASECTYDANGNRLSSIQTTGSGAGAQTTRRTYTVDPASNRILSFTQTQLAGTATTGGATSNVNYSFDANGSLLRDGLRSKEFDAANRLGNVTTGTGPDAPTTRYVHNALGQRLFKTEPLYAPVSSGSNPADPGVMQTLANFFASLWGGSTTTAAPSASEKLGYTYYYDEDGSLLYEQGSGGANSGGSAHYVYLPTPAGPMPISTYTGSKHYAVHTDHLNTPRRLTNSAKQVAWQWAFSAFGDEQPITARNRYVDPATTPNAGTTTVADVTFNLRYPGQYFDKESGLSYNYFRSYDSRTGRYTQSDPIGLRGGWNRFGYAENNPLMYVDPLGLFTCGPGYRAIQISDRVWKCEPDGSDPNQKQCVTGECAAGLPPTTKANPNACEIRCGSGSDDWAGRSLVCGAVGQGGKLLGAPGIPLTLGCKYIDKRACIKKCEVESQPICRRG